MDCRDGGLPRERCGWKPPNSSAARSGHPDYAVIVPRLQRVYEWSAEELGEPRLLELVRDGYPIYAWRFEDLLHEAQRIGRHQQVPAC